MIPIGPRKPNAAVALIAAVVALALGLSLSLGGRAVTDAGSVGALPDSAARAAQATARGTSIAIAVAVGALALALGIVTFIRAQNTRS